MSSVQYESQCPQCLCSDAFTESECSNTTMHCPRCGYHHDIDHHQGTVKRTKGYGCMHLKGRNGITTVISFTHAMHGEERRADMLQIINGNHNVSAITMTRKRRREWIAETFLSPHPAPQPLENTQPLMTEEELLEEAPF